MKEKLESSIVSFISWLERNTYESYDVYDFWSSSIGIKAKRYFNENKLLASPLVGVLQVLDSFFPRSRFLFAKKKQKQERKDGENEWRSTTWKQRWSAEVRDGLRLPLPLI